MVWPLALLTLGGVIGCNLAMDRLSVMQFAWIAMVQPVTTLFVSSIIQREPLTIRQLTGGMVLISASILSSLWSV
jgi:drug/metabolite transporter (DMT)-like permease